MSIAKDALDQLSQDPATHRLARERVEAIKLYRFELAAHGRQARAEGEAKGRTEGEPKVLLKLLGLRFGPVSEVAKAHVEAASLEQLDTWAERILTAATLDEVLAA
jgi:Domain of unknown function (DUF4351)